MLFHRQVDGQYARAEDQQGMEGKHEETQVAAWIQCGEVVQCFNVSAVGRCWDVWHLPVCIPKI